MMILICYKKLFSTYKKTGSKACYLPHSGYSDIVVLLIVRWWYIYTITPLTLETIMWKRFLNWYQAYAQYKAAKIVIAELNRLTDKELKDIGIGRSEIRAVAYGIRET